MKPLREEDLIEFHLGEMPFLQSEVVARRIGMDPELAAQSEEIASVLRAFACDGASAPPAGAEERAWQRVRPALTVLEKPRRSFGGRFWVGTLAGSLATAMLVAGFAMHWLRVAPAGPVAGVTANAAMSSPGTKSWSDALLKELHMRRPAVQVNQRPGPLTTGPVDVVAENSALAAHLDTAERVLTEVSHTDGALPDETRGQVHKLLLENAMYHETAEASGDRSTAAVIDDLGRVLISLDAEPQGKDAAPDAFRVQMNMGGVLLDLRILHRNDKPKGRQ